MINELGHARTLEVINELEHARTLEVIGITGAMEDFWQKAFKSTSVVG